MSFKEFLNEEATIEQIIWPWISKVKAYILQSIHISNNAINIKFPSTYNVYDQSPMQLVAHTIYDEGIGQEHPYGKGGLAFNAIGADFAKSFDSNQARNFQKSLNSSISKIFQEMGELFELEIFMYFVKNGFGVVSYTKNDAMNKIEQLMDQINRKTTSKILQERIRQFIEKHAQDMGESIMQRTNSVLRCKANTVEFAGGSGWDNTTTTKFRKTADLILSCNNGSGIKELGWSTKFSSETMISVAKFEYDKFYSLFGGDYQALKVFVSTNKEKEVKNYILDEIEDVLSSMEESKIELFLNEILFGYSKKTGVDTLLAFRNYVRNKGNADWSGGLQLDFNVSDKTGKKLFLKPNSEITVNKTTVYVTLNIKVPNGSWNGTSIRFRPMPSKEAIVVAMNNLTSDGKNR